LLVYCYEITSCSDTETRYIEAISNSLERCHSHFQWPKGAKDQKHRVCVCVCVCDDGQKMRHYEASDKNTFEPQFASCLPAVFCDAFGALLPLPGFNLNGFWKNAPNWVAALVKRRCQAEICWRQIGEHS